MSDQPANVIEALSAVMRELPAIGKDLKADPRQGGYAYRGIEAITAHAQPLFAKYGIVFVPRVTRYEVKDIIVNGNPWTDTLAQVEYSVFGPGGVDDCIIVGPILAIGRDNSDKGGNKCLTQAFKYALVQVLCISDGKDDADAGSPEADAAQQDPEAERLKKIIRDAVEREAITTKQAQEAASAHGVGTKTALAAASASVMASVVETLGLSTEGTT